MRKLLQFIKYNLIPFFIRLKRIDSDHNKKLIFYCSDYSSSGGLTDRLKGIISAYQISIITNREFKIIYNQPFKLKKILDENHVKWHMSSPKEESKILRNSKHYNLMGRKNNHNFMKLINKIIMDKNDFIAIRINFDYSEIINNKFGNLNFEWSYYFNKLFKYSKYTNKVLSDYLESNPSEFSVGLHCRFINLMGDNIEKGKELSEENRLLLLEKIIKTIQTISLESINKILLCSDSNKFLNEILQKDSVKRKIIIAKGKPKHSEKNIVSNLELQKIILDFFLLSYCNSVYSITYDGLYPSEFPKYAAKLNSRKFIIIKE
tara:strand:+ start:1557 stop:2516 length:960 start_codon:yes stop_codon:yes gene_type:complete